MASSLFSILPSLLTITDEQAMWRVKMDDDPQAFARLVERWQGPIQRLCIKMLGDAHRAEDLTQEAFAGVRAAEGLRTCGPVFDVPLANCTESLL